MKPKQKILLNSAIFGAVILVLIIFLIHPLFKEIKKNSEDLILAKKELIFLQAKIENLEEFKEIYRALEPDLEKIDLLFIDPGVPIDFIKFLEKTGVDSRVSINISPISIKKSKIDPWSLMGFQITLAGSFSNCLKSLEKIETAPYLIEIQNLNIRRLTEREIQIKEFEKISPGDVKTTLLIKVFSK